MSGVDEFSPDISPTLFDTAMYETATEKRWPTPKATEWKGARGPGQGGHGGEYLTGAVKRLPQSTSSAAASPASPSATLAGDWVPKTPAGSGPSSCESYARLGPDGCWLKMYQDSFQLKMDGSLEECSGTWPRAGTMRNGTAYRRPPLVPRTSAIGSSLWPTPQVGGQGGRYQWAKDGKGGRDLTSEVQALEKRWPTPQAYSHGPDSNPPGITKLDIEVRGMYPTPQAHDAAKGDPARVGRYGTKHGGRNLNDEVLLPTPTANRRSGLQSHGKNVVTGQLNADWVSLLMGFPKDYTKLEED